MPDAQPTRLSCIQLIKDLDYNTQMKTIRSWLDKRKIGPSLYNDLLQYVRSNYWLSDSNQTNEDTSSDEIVSSEFGTPEEQKTPRTYSQAPAKVEGAPNTEAMMDRVEFAVRYAGGKWGWVVPAEFAANLERKLRALMAKHGEQ